MISGGHFPIIVNGEMAVINSGMPCRSKWLAIGRSHAISVAGFHALAAPFSAGSAIAGSDGVYFLIAHGPGLSAWQYCRLNKNNRRGAAAFFQASIMAV